MTEISSFALNTAYLLGFKRIADVRGITDTGQLFEPSGLLNQEAGCGIYLLIYPNETAYIGQCVNFRRRFKQHLERGSVINEIAFMSVPVTELDETEKTLIAKAERLGIPIMNIALRAKQERESRNLNDLIGEKEIAQWLQPDEHESGTNYHKEYASMLPGLRHGLDLAMAEPIWFQALSIARSFVKEAIIEPEKTADFLWCAWAYTKHVTERFIPVIRLYAASSCVFGAGYWQADKTHCYAYIQLPQTVYEQFFDAKEVASFGFLLIESHQACMRITAPAPLMQHAVERLRLPLRQAMIELMKEHPNRKNNRALCSLLY